MLSLNQPSLSRDAARDAGPALESHEAILAAFEEGKLTPAQAFNLFHNLRERSVGGHPDSQAKALRLKETMGELESLVGLENVKALVKEIQAFIEIQKKRAQERLITEPLVLHMVFKGNPGTGKTTVARIFGKMFREMGVLEKGHLIEVERADLVGEYIGHTAQRTREQIRKSLGGILFIDEAYSLARGGEKDFGKEAIDTLVKAMEDHKDKLILILAGYTDEMESFIQTNPGIRSRFPIHIDFPDYTPEELLSIADLMVNQREYKLASDARRKLAALLWKKQAYPDHNMGNARLVRNLIEKAIRRHAVRLVTKDAPTREELMVIRMEDIVEEC